MIWLGLLAGAALIVALLAWSAGRRAARRLDRLEQSYWDLRYEHGRLRAQVQRLDPETAGSEPPPPQDDPSATFIPLSSLKR